MAYGEEAVRFDSNLTARGGLFASARIVAGLSCRSKRPLPSGSDSLEPNSSATVE
jgi:hypothetical protein